MTTTCSTPLWYPPHRDGQDDYVTYPGCDHPYHELSLWGKKSLYIKDFVAHEPCITPSPAQLSKINASLADLTEENSDYFVESDPDTVMYWQREAEQLGVVYRFRCIGEVTNTKIRLPQRTAFWLLVKKTPNLNWLIGTRHPHLISECLPKDWSAANYPNVTLTLKLDDDERAPIKIAQLGEVEAAYRWVIWDGPRDDQRETQFI